LPILGEEDPKTLVALGDLVEALRLQGIYGEAIRLGQICIRRKSNVHGTEHPETMTSYNNLALALKQKGEFAEAEKLHRRGFGI